MLDCCKNKKNRKVLSSNSGSSFTDTSGKQFKAITRIEQCIICNKKHYHMDAEPFNTQMDSM